MIVQVVSQEQKLMGYVVNNYFLPKNLLFSICESLPKADKTVVGIKVNDFIVTTLGNYAVYSDYLKVLSSNDFGLSIKKICFLERPPDTDDMVDLSSFWRIYCVSRSIVYTVLDNNFNILGFIMTDTRLKVGGTCYVCMFEVVSKGDKNGTRIISELIKLVSLKGYSCVTAIPFWKSMGAEFSDNFHFKLLQHI